MSELNLSGLQEPFPLEDIEWRVSRAGMGGSGIFCMVLAYITARAIQKRLDDVCGPERWKLQEPRILGVNGKDAFACGISIWTGGEWVTKWDVSEPTNIEPAKGGFSGAMKRAGAQWGIGRYLYHLDETFAETSENKPAIRSMSWHYAKLPEKAGGAAYYWKAPSLPGWALPKEPEHEVSASQLSELKKAWRDKFAPDGPEPGQFTRFVESVAGAFPVADYTCWTGAAFQKCMDRIESTEDATGVDSDVPFDGAKQ